MFTGMRRHYRILKDSNVKLFRGKSIQNKRDNLRPDKLFKTKVKKNGRNFLPTITAKMQTFLFNNSKINVGLPVLIHHINHLSNCHGTKIKLAAVNFIKSILAGMVNVEVTLHIRNKFS